MMDLFFFLGGDECLDPSPVHLFYDCFTKSGTIATTGRICVFEYLSRERGRFPGLFRIVDNRKSPGWTRLNPS